MRAAGAVVGGDEWGEGAAEGWALRGMRGNEGMCGKWWGRGGDVMSLERRGARGCVRLGPNLYWPVANGLNSKASSRRCAADMQL